MTYQTPKYFRIGLLTALTLVAFEGTALASGSPAASADTATHEQAHIKDMTSRAMARERQALADEAVKANVDILAAVVSLSNNDKDTAYKALSDASGKLDSLLARDPHMKRVPIDIHVSTKELDATPSAIKQALSKASKALSGGQVQDARSILKPMTSEIRITTDYVPMDTFPGEIKTATQEIQSGKTEQAAHRLIATLDSVVSEEKIIPIPPLKAETDVQESEQLIKADPVKNKAAALALLGQAKSQLDVAKLLGYGDFKDIHQELDTVKQKINGKTWDEKAFDRLDSLFKDVKAKF